MNCLHYLYDKYKNAYLNKVEYGDTIPFIPPLDKCKVIKVYDGDTITVAQKLPYKKSPIYRFSVRLNGIDCPEIKGKNPDEKQCAQYAKKFVSKLIMNEIVELRNISTEKYGRVLADVHYKNYNISELLIKEHLAVAYDGGTKKAPQSWIKYYDERDRV